MPATVVTRSDATKAIVKRTAVFIKELRNGAYVYIREPYDIVEYDRSHQAAGANKLTTYYLFNNVVRPAPGGSEYRVRGNDVAANNEELYDDVLVLDQRPSSAPNR